MNAQPWQLDSEQYEFHFPVTPLYAHLDTERHVNNVAVQSFHSEARLRFQMQALGPRSWFSDTVLLRPRRTVTHFIGETHYLSDVTCAARLVTLEKDRYRLALGLFQNGECVGVQECLMGAWQGDRWVALPGAVHEALAEGLRPAPSLSDWPPLEVDDQGFDAWPGRSKLAPRYADLDPDRRLAELSVCRYMEQSRAAPLDMLRLPDLGLLVARIDIGYQRWNKGVQAVELPSCVGRIGNSSFVVRSAVRVGDETVAVCESVMVLMNRRTHRPTPIAPPLREAMSALSMATKTTIATETSTEQ